VSATGERVAKERRVEAERHAERAVSEAEQPLHSPEGQQETIVPTRRLSIFLGKGKRRARLDLKRVAERNPHGAQDLGGMIDREDPSARVDAKSLFLGEITRPAVGRVL